MKCFSAFDKYRDENIIVLDDSTTMNDYVWDQVFEMKEFRDIPDEVKLVCRNATAGEYENIDHTEDEDEEDS